MSTTSQTNTYQDNLKGLRENLGKMLPENVLRVFDNDAEALHTQHQSILKLKIGEKAPDFSLSNATNETVKLSNLLQKGKVVLAFYRGTWCPYCNLQLAHYQNTIEEIQALGAQLVAISPQTPDESLSIKEKNKLKFEVLSDNGNIVARNYTTVFKNNDAPVKTMTELGLDFDGHYSDDSRELPVPAVYIIEKDGTITFAKAAGGDYRIRVEASEIIDSLKK
ncbi:peroxiredoxin-like family protein [Maribacter sp. 2308TA10-17]|uniref:peroxiredoxin-like family protein n=1 Tax=Maribacter sp. 2308TA10-17 TaxID=3386276 RepID=UPI0039BD09F3